MQRVNQPDRLSLDSFADTTTATNGLYNTFSNTAPTTALVGAKKIHLLRASVPYIPTASIPLYQCVFYYYALGEATDIPEAGNLRAVRLFPSDYIAPSGFNTYVQNRIFQSPSDLAAALTLAAAAGGDDDTYNTLFAAGDVTFTYNSTFNQIFFTGTDPALFYCNAGYNDPIVLASQRSDDIVIPNQDGSTQRQPSTPGFTLNLRVGYAMDGVQRPRGAGSNLVSNSCANLTGITFAGAVPPDTYPDLNYSSNMYIYSNIVGNSGYGAYGRKNLLGVIPMNVPIGGVANFDGHGTAAYATKVASEIYSVDIELRDDANMPFLLPDSANVNLEINILYE
jgi:hypothetical protein